MPARIGLGIVGVGRMGADHARIIARDVPEARLVALAGLDTTAAQQLADELGVPHVYASAAQLAADPEVQGVLIAASTYSHLELVRAVAAEGRDILCEKPLALSLEDTDAAIAAAHDAGVRLQVAFMRRWDPAYRQAHDRLADGGCGRPFMFKSLQFDGGPPPRAYADPAVSGGIMVDMGVHEFDLARWLMTDEVVEVHAWGSTLAHPQLAEVGDVDSAAIALRFAGGAIGTVELGRSSRIGDEVRTEVWGSSDSVYVVERAPSGDPSARIFQRAYAEQARGFVQALREDAPVAVSGADARAAYLIARAADASRHGGGPVLVGA
ncbi:MAG: Gfo/Idh/MocA family protein [Candidatus Limnocylindrales bacterium]